MSKTRDNLGIYGLVKSCTKSTECLFLVVYWCGEGAYIGCGCDWVQVNAVISWLTINIKVRAVAESYNAFN